MPRTPEQFGPNVVKKEPVVGSVIPAETDVQSYLVSRDQQARLGVEAEKRIRDFNVWILSTPMYHVQNEVPDAETLRTEAHEERNGQEEKTRFVYYRSVRYDELKRELADVYPRYGEVYSFRTPDLVMVYGGDGYADDEPESPLSRSMRDAEELPIRDIRKAADSVLFHFLPSGERIECDWSDEFLGAHILAGKRFELITKKQDVTAALAAEDIATNLFSSDRDWAVSGKAFDEYARSGDEAALAKIVTPGRIRRAISRSQGTYGEDFLRYAFEKSSKDANHGFQERASFDEHCRELAMAVRTFAEGEQAEDSRKEIVSALKRIVDERVAEYLRDVEIEASERRLLQPIIVAVGPSLRFRDRAIVAGADATLSGASLEEVKQLVSLTSRMRSSPASIARERLRRNKSDFYRGVEDEVESRSELTADTGKEVFILSSLFEKIGAKKVLDVGCGYGRLAKPLAEQGFEVTGIDANRSLLEKAKDAKGKRRNLHYKKGDIIEYRDAVKGGSYDAVYYGWHSFLEAHGLGNALASLRSAYAALRQGGALTFDQPSRENPGMEDGSYGDESHGYFAYLMDESELDLMLRLAGFEGLHIHKWTTKPSELYPEGMKKWTIVATKPEAKESENKWWLEKDDWENYGRPIQDAS